MSDQQTTDTEETRVKPGPEALRQAEVLRQNTVEILPEDELAVRIQMALDEKRPLRIKYGADPSAPDLHVGHVVGLRKLRQFQDLGHQVVFLIGNFTAMIGDPSGKSETRKRLSPEQVAENARTYFEQVYLILDREKTEVVYNADWLGNLNLANVIELAAQTTVARMLERDDFTKRFQSETPIYIHEFLYPLVQAYDSVAVRADVELGGTDQKFNLLLGREVQRSEGQAPQITMTLPLLVGTDGVKKMSKSLGNYIGVSDAPNDIFGKTMSIADELMGDYLRMVLYYGEDDAKALEDQVAGGSLHPRDLKARIASELVALFHGEAAAGEAREHFDRVFRDQQAPEEMEEVEMAIAAGEETMWIAPLLVQAGLAASNRKARQAVGEGSVRIDGEKVGDQDTHLGVGEYVVQVGKRQFRRIRLTS